jgi:hypothetical protein
MGRTNPDGGTQSSDVTTPRDEAVSKGIANGVPTREQTGVPSTDAGRMGSPDAGASPGKAATSTKPKASADAAKPQIWMPVTFYVIQQTGEDPAKPIATIWSDSNVQLVIRFATSKMLELFGITLETKATPLGFKKDADIKTGTSQSIRTWALKYFGVDPSRHKGMHVFCVRSLTNTFGQPTPGSTDQRSNCAAIASTGIWVLTHELGHALLGPSHDSPAGNLMSGLGVGGQLTPDQKRDAIVNGKRDRLLFDKSGNL